MNEQGKAIATGTGMTAAVLALGTALQMLLFWVGGGAGITDEQGDALAVLLYPFVAYAWSKVGFKVNGNGNGVPPADASAPPVAH